MPSFDEMLRELDAPKTKSFDEMLRELDAQSATPALSLRNATKADESPSFDDLMQMQTQVGTPEQEAANQAALAEGGENIKRFINDTYHAGMGGVETGMANMSDALAHGVRAVPLMGGVADWIGEGSNWWDARAREHAQKVGANNLWTSSVNALGSTAPSMAASLALAATGNLSQAGQMLMPKGLMSLPQKMLSAAMMYRSGEEAIGNAGRTYREAIQEGRSPEQAQSQANRQLAAELPMNVFFDKAGIFGDAWDGIQSPLKRGLAMTLSEVIGQGGQEVGQDVIGDAAAATRDRGIPEYLRAIGENVTNAEYLKQKMKDTFLPTGLSSLIGAALGLGVRSMRNGRGGNVDNFARGVPDTGTQQAVAEIMQPVKEAWRREELNNWVPQSVGTVPGNVAPQTPEKMSDVFKPVEPQPVIPETAKPLPGAMPAAETPVPTGKKAEAVAAANMQKVAEIADVTPAVEQPAQKELIPEDTDETLDDLRAQMAEEYRNVRQMDAEERENLPPSTLSGLMEQSGRRYEQSPNVRDVIGRAPEQDMVISGEESTQQAGREGEFVQSMREVQERVTRQLKDAGADDETANAGGEVWANHLLARARALGMDEHGRLRSDALTPAELDKLEIEGERAAENASDTYGQTAADEIKRQGQLKRDRIAWSRAVDKFIAGEMGSHDFARVMDMPLALQLAGAPVREIVADHKFFGHTLRGKHSAQITPALMKKLVTSLADPIMVFDSDSHPGTSLVAMLELQDNLGATVVVLVRLQMNPGDPKSPAKITSFYGKGNADTRAPNNRWFVNQIKKGNLRYINTKKSTRWSSAGGLQLPKVLAPTGSFKNSIKTEADLVKLRKENGNRFYQEQEERAQIIEAAKENGTYLKTPYGTETNLTPEQWVLVRTKQFKEWFGDWENDPENASKVLDGNGEPLVVYHGSTHTGFSTFSTAGSTAYLGTGAFFSGRKDVAATYSGSDELVSREPGTSEPALSGEGVYPVFLNLRNPYRVDAEGKDWTNVGEISVYDNETGESIYERDGEPFRTPREAEEYIERDLDDYSGRYEVSYSAEMTTNEIAQSVGEGNYGDGFDGVIFENVIDEGRWGDVLSADNVYVAFAPNQIKAVDNRGTFSSADANIYNQSAWHGSPHRFDEFDLGAIGGGEGAQVHGWGLYFAQNREVAEGYRERLKSEGEQATVDYDAVEEYKTRHGEGTPEREALETVLEVFRDLGGEERGEDSVAAYESTQAKIGERRMGVEGRIADLESLKKTGKSIDEGYLSRLKAKRELVKLEETALDKFFNVGWGDSGSLFEVDVPKNDVLLDEDKSLAEHSDKVRKAIHKIVRNMTDEQFEDSGEDINRIGRANAISHFWRVLSDSRGKQVYGTLIDILGGAREASLALNDAGIKGITYDGYQDGRCFVVFDDKAISVINRFNQRENAIRRGQIRIGSHGEGLVTLFKHADRSTFFHEIGHMMLDDLIADGLLEKANARTKADLETVKRYLHIEGMDLSKRHTFTGKKKERYAEAQERFARSFEAYLMEGKSPTAEMRGVFAKIKQWLIDIYRDIKRLGVELSPEVREVFDRLLATPERGDFGPIFRGYEGEAAIEKLLKERQGEVVGAMSDPRLGENSSIDFVWGTEKYGLAHIEKKHGADALMRIPQIIRKGAPRPLINHRISYETDEGLVVLKNEWKGAEKNWILTSYLPQGTKKDSRSAQDTQTGGRTEESASSSDGNLFSPRISQNPNNSNRDFSVRSDLPQVTVTAEPGSKSAGTLIRIKDIYDKLRKIAPVRKGVSAPSDVAGYYTPETDVARERHWGDFPTALHEIGHALDYKLGLRESVRDAETSRQLYDELCELGKATAPQNVNTIYERLHGCYMHASGAEARGPDVSAATLKFEEAQRYLMKEGIAEFFRGYAYNPDLMEVVAPEYTKLFREALDAHEEYRQPVGELFDAIRGYNELTPEQKLRAGMIRGDEKVKNQKGARAAAAEAWNGFRQKFDDQLRYLEQMQNLLRDRVRDLAKEHGGRYADMLQHGELKEEFAVYDMLRTMPGYMGKAKRDVLVLMEPVKKLGDEMYAKLTGYMKAMRALDYWDNGLEPGIGLTRAEVSAVVNRTRHENPELARIAEDIAKAYEAMIERTLIDSGVWSRGQYEEYKKRWPHYVPFVRVNEDGAVASPTRRGKGIVNLSNQVKQTTGVGTAEAVVDTKDPFEMMVKNALVFNQLAEKNRAAQALVRAALADPALFADVIEPVQGGERSGDTFTVWFDGKRRAFTGDKKLIDALAAMEQAAGIRNPIFGSLDRAAQGAANLLKLGATRANPAFILTNFIRDAMYSSLTNSARGARSMPFFGTVKGLLMQTAKDDASKQRIADALDHGLAYSGITELGLNASEKGISKYVGKAVHGDKGFLRKLASAWDNTIGKYNEMVELAPKFAEYERLVKEGYPKRYAARMAREVNLDFSRGGQWGKVWNRYTAFFNPAVQGTSKLVRTAAAHPGRFAARTAMYVILPSLISWMAGRDDDEYKRISRNIKDRYWVFKVGGTWLRLPKPELAGMFGSAVERVLDAAFEHDPMAFRELGRSVWEGFSPNLLPTFAEPILEHRMGKTFFYDSPLIPPQLENLPPELQFTKNTSSMAKFLGKAWGVSPILIDHYVSSYGGGVGEYLSKVPDIFLKPQEEAKKLSEKPLFSRFTVDPNRNSESLAKFYDLRRQATVAKNAYDVRRKMGEQPEYSAGVHMAKAFDQAARKLSDWRKDIAAIQQSKSMTPERKREVIDRIRLRMNQEAEAAVGSYFTVKEKLDRRKR